MYPFNRGPSHVIHLTCLCQENRRLETITIIRKMAKSCTTSILKRLQQVTQGANSHPPKNSCDWKRKSFSHDHAASLHDEKSHRPHANVCLQEQLNTNALCAFINSSTFCYIINERGGTILSRTVLYFTLYLAILQDLYPTMGNGNGSVQVDPTTLWSWPLESKSR